MNNHVVNGTVERVFEGKTKTNKIYYSFELNTQELGLIKASWFSESGGRFEIGDEIHATIEENGQFKNITMMGKSGEQPTLDETLNKKPTFIKKPTGDSPAFLGMIFNKSVDIALASCQKVGQDGSFYYDLGEHNAKLLEKLETTFDDLRNFAKAKQEQYGGQQ